MTVALERWRQLRRPDSSWRERARATIRHVVDANPELVAEPEKLLKLIDAAYPFGERRYHPYVKWRAEYRLVEDALMQLDSPPDRADAEVFDVARDLLMLGKPADATAMLDKLAPTRLGRRCPACGAARGKPCFAVEDKSPMVVPHDARVLVSRDHGPLFGAEADEGRARPGRDVVLRRGVGRCHESRVMLPFATPRWRRPNPTCSTSDFSVVDVGNTSTSGKAANRRRCAMAARKTSPCCLASRCFDCGTSDEQRLLRGEARAALHVPVVRPTASRRRLSVRGSRRRCRGARPQVDDAAARAAPGQCAACG